MEVENESLKEFDKKSHRNKVKPKRSRRMSSGDENYDVHESFENGKKRTRGRSNSEDFLNPSPTLGKRQRKVNTLYSGFAIDKKTSHVFGKEKKRRTPLSSPLKASPKQEFTREIITPEGKTKKLPKGYAYEPILETEEVEQTPKRERKKLSLSSPKPNVNQSLPQKRRIKKKVMHEPRIIRVPQETGTRQDDYLARKKNVDEKIASMERQIEILEGNLSLFDEEEEEVEFEESLSPKRRRKTTKAVIYDYDSDEVSKARKNKFPRSKGAKLKASQTKLVRPKRPKRREIFEIEEEEEEIEYADELDDESEPEDLIELSPLMQSCRRLLIRIRSHPQASSFNTPVDTVALGIPEYFDIIKNPMDLGTVLANLEAGDYETLESFADDVNLVWTNAYTFNPPDHEVVKMANILENLFKQGLRQIQEQFKLSNLDDDQSDPMRSTINEIKNSMKEVREEIQKLKREKGVNSPAVQTPRGRKSSKAFPREDAREMTFEEKKNLSISINELEQENLGKVVQIINQRRPLNQQGNSDEIEIDIDALDAATLRALERYVKSCQRKKQKISNKMMQAEINSQRTKKSIEDVKERLQQIEKKSKKLSKKKREMEDSEDVVVDDGPSNQYPGVEIEKDDESSSSSSSSSSESSSSTDSDASSDNQKKKKKKAPIQSETYSEPGDRSEPSLTPVENEPEPEILQATSAFERRVEIKNLDSWTNFGASFNEDSSESLSTDKTWSQFQTLEMQKQQREKDRQEQEEKLRKERVERELERKKQEEERKKESERIEREKMKKAEEKAKHLEQQREQEKRTREAQSKSNTAGLLEQSMLMSSFEQEMNSSKGIFDMFRLKENQKDEK